MWTLIIWLWLPGNPSSKNIQAAPAMHSENFNEQYQCENALIKIREANNNKINLDGVCIKTQLRIH